ncbi:MAG: DUF4252 domain-containing protein [Bacteroidales bacterium]|nr:DUF4252 domain-containing protein [Bacteroidales bacterium]
MKRIIAIAALLFTFIGAFAQNGKSMYGKYSDKEGVSAVYISPAMFRLMGKLPNLNVEGEDVNLAPIIKSLSGFYLLSAENAEVCGAMDKDVRKLISKGRYEMLMEAKDSGETVRMYTAGTENVVKSFIMLSVGNEKTTFICLDGKMDRERLEKAIASKIEE